MEKQSRIIEFFGIPGSGKTFIKNRVLAALQEMGNVSVLDRIKKRHRIIRVMHKLCVLLYEYIANPKRLFKQIKLVSSSNQETVSDGITTLLHWVYIGHMYRKSYKNDIVLIDQGIFQAIWSLLFKAQNKISIDEITSAYFMPLPDLLCIVSVTQDTMEQRIKSRKSTGSRIERSQVKDLPGLLERSMVIYDKMVNYVAKCRSEHIIVDNNEDGQIDTIVNKLITAFKRNKYL